MFKLTNNLSALTSIAWGIVVGITSVSIVQMFVSKENHPISFFTACMLLGVGVIPLINYIEKKRKS